MKLFGSSPCPFKVGCFHLCTHSTLAYIFYKVIHAHSLKNQIVLSGLLGKKQQFPDSPLISHLSLSAAIWFFWYISLFSKLYTSIMHFNSFSFSHYLVTSHYGRLEFSSLLYHHIYACMCTFPIPSFSQYNYL